VSVVRVRINGAEEAVREGISVAAAIASTGHDTFRRSLRGMPRGPLCGMGICFECRVCVDGRPGRRACRERCRDGMQIETGDA